MNDEIRACVSPTNYKKTMRLLDLPITIGFDKALTILLANYEKSVKKH